MKHHPKPEVPSLLRIDPAIYHDARGFFLELYHANKYGAALGSQTLFVQDNLSVSKKNALRGLHYQVKNPLNPEQEFMRVSLLPRLWQNLLKNYSQINKIQLSNLLFC